MDGMQAHMKDAEGVFLNASKKGSCVDLAKAGGFFRLLCFLVVVWVCLEVFAFIFDGAITLFPPADSKAFVGRLLPTRFHSGVGRNHFLLPWLELSLGGWVVSGWVGGWVVCLVGSLVACWLGCLVHCPSITGPSIVSVESSTGLLWNELWAWKAQGRACLGFVGGVGLGKGLILGEFRVEIGWVWVELGAHFCTWLV